MKDYLLKMGLDPSLRGFHYLAALCEDYLQDEEKSVVRRYADVAKRFNVDWKNVERCARFAVDRLVDTAPMHLYTSRLMAFPALDTGSYTVGKFVALAALAYRRDLLASGVTPLALP